MADECATPVGILREGTANEYDYQRFFWDLADKDGLLLADLLEIISLANEGWSSPWNPVYDPNAPENNTRFRLEAAASALGVAGPWNSRAAANGVHR